jgi:hypothetical protein
MYCATKASNYLMLQLELQAERINNGKSMITTLIRQHQLPEIVLQALDFE